MTSKNFSKITIITLLVAIIAIIAPTFAHASQSEINYATIKDIKGDKMVIKYKSPDKNKGYICNISNLECQHKSTSTPELFPGILGKKDYTNSPGGNYGLITRKNKTKEDSNFFHLLYSLKNEKPKLNHIIPFKKPISWGKFSWADDNVVLFGKDGTLARFSIEDKKISTTTISQSYLPFKSLSPHAKYLSAYNYGNEEHRIWNLDSTKIASIPSTTPDFIEFSQDEKRAVFANAKGDFETLYAVNLGKMNKTQNEEKLKPQRLFEEDFMVKDYLFFKNDLYYVANRENPLKWALYKYSFSTDKNEKITGNVSYADYIRPAGNNYLAFLTIEGKNTNVSLYKPETDTTKELSPIEESPGFENTEQRIIKVNDTQGVLIAPKSIKNKELFIWLHGGPQRQTSIGYHSYLSYAVYDELLERLANAGNYVLKLDYTGSIGYGQSSIKKLDGNLGKVEVEDVVATTKKLKDEYNIEKVHLIGNSYGGYLAPRSLVESPELFNSSVSINGVFNWLSLIERIPSSPFKRYFEGPLQIEGDETNFNEYSQSLIEDKLSNISNEKLLLIYGEKDSNVPTWQTREFYTLTKALDKNVSILPLPDEGHILRERETLDKLCNFISKELKLKNTNCKNK